MSSRTPKILNLILYSPGDDCYELMAETLTKYLDRKGIRHYFYSYRNDIDGDEGKMKKDDFVFVGNHLYIRGTETFLPGILDKTLEALKIIQDEEYDYVVRSNVSTVIDFDELMKYLPIGAYDYAGPLYYTGCYIDVKSGTTPEKHAIYKAHHFVAGICIVLSRKAVEMLVIDAEKVRAYGVIDDLAIGWYFHDHLQTPSAQIVREIICGIEKTAFCPTKKIDGTIAYRNKSTSRAIDVCMMDTIVKQLLA